MQSILSVLAAIAVLRAGANRFNVTIGIGPAVSFGGGTSRSGGVGILFAPGNVIGLYGSLSAALGAIASASLTGQVTIVRGGVSSFRGDCLGMGVDISGGAFTLVSGQPVRPNAGVVALFTVPSPPRFLGITLSAGLTVGPSPLEVYAQVSRTWTT